MEGQGRQGLLNEVRYDGTGKPTADYPVDKPFTAPKLPSSGIPWMVPKSDFFTATTLNPEWSFLGYMPDSKYSLTQRPGWLGLSPKANKINPLTKNDGEHNYSLITHLNFNPGIIDDEAGLIILRGDESIAVKLYSSVNDSGNKVIDFSYNGNKYEINNGIGYTLWLKMIRVNHVISGYCSKNGIDWIQVGQTFDVSAMDAYSDYTSFTGNRQGIYVNNSGAYFDLYIYRDAYSPILAECPANQLGTCRTATTQGISVLDSIHNNDWAMYAGVEFGNNDYGKANDSIQFTASSATNGGSIEVWLDSIQTGQLIGTCNISNTGGWNAFKTFSAKVKQTTGRHDLYLRFVGSATGKLFQLEWAQFTLKQAPQYMQSYLTNDSTVCVKLDENVAKPTLPCGFSVTLNNIDVDSITNISISASDSSLLYISLKKKIQGSDVISISYRNGSIKTTYGLALVPFTNSIVDNVFDTVSTKIYDSKLDNAFTVFPNPNNTGEFFYTIDNSIIKENINIEVVASNGNIIYEQKVSGFNGTITINNASTGCYFIHLRNNEYFINKPILIQ